MTALLKLSPHVGNLSLLLETLRNNSESDSREVLQVCICFLDIKLYNNQRNVRRHQAVSAEQRVSMIMKIMIVMISGKICTYMIIHFLHNISHMFMLSVCTTEASICHGPFEAIVCKLNKQ